MARLFGILPEHTKLPHARALCAHHITLRHNTVQHSRALPRPQAAPSAGSCPRVAGEAAALLRYFGCGQRDGGVLTVLDDECVYEGVAHATAAGDCVRACACARALVCARGCVRGRGADWVVLCGMSRAGYQGCRCDCAPRWVRV